MVLERQAEKVNVYQHLLTLFAISYESSTEGTNFRIMLRRFKFV